MGGRSVGVVLSTHCLGSSLVRSSMLRTVCVPGQPRALPALASQSAVHSHPSGCWEPRLPLSVPPAPPTLQAAHLAPHSHQVQRPPVPGDQVHQLWAQHGAQHHLQLCGLHGQAGGPGRAGAGHGPCAACLLAHWPACQPFCYSSLFCLRTRRRACSASFLCGHPLFFLSSCVLCCST